MSTFDKLKQRIKNRPKDFTYSEAKTLLSHLGFEESTKGKTSGSRVKFFRPDDLSVIMLHKPHPGDVMKPGAVRDLVNHLEEMGEI